MDDDRARRMVAGTDIPARYSRQVLFEGIGAEGQAAIMRSRMAIAGCGALGSLQASLLVRAGVGTLRIIDRDFVEESNLQRQVLFDEEDARTMQPKAMAAAGKLRAINSLVTVEGMIDDINPSTIDRLLGGMDVIVDATDNFETRFLVNDYAVKTGTPWVYGACVGSYGLTFTIVPGETACLRCVFETAPPPGLAPSCDTAGVLGSVVGLIASLQVAEALKIVAGRREKLSSATTLLDVWENLHDRVELPPRDPACPCCGQHRFEYLEGTGGSDTTSICGRDAVQVRRGDGLALDLDALAARLKPLGKLERNRFLLRAEIDGYQLTVFGDGRAIIGGTRDPAVAKAVYARYIGM
jgi:molybdopterin-synthase adenylyltransferase